MDLGRLPVWPISRRYYCHTGQAPGAVMRLWHIDDPHEEGAMTSFRGTRTAVALACITAALSVAAMFAACGGTSGSSSAPSPAASSTSGAASTPDASPSPRPSPQITHGPLPRGAVVVVRRYWNLLGALRYDAAFALTTGPHMYNAGTEPKVLRSARYVRPATSALPRPGNDATVEFGSWVYIVPTATGSPFGTRSARWQMYSRVVRMSDGSWRLVELGTGE